MNNGVPLPVQLARLAHKLESLHHYLANDRYIEAEATLYEAQDMVDRLQGSVR